MKNEFVIVNVRLDRVKPNPFQTRLVEDPEHVAQLAGDILANGLLEVPAGRRVDEDGNPLVFGLSETDIQLAYGHNRLAAYKLLSGSNPDYGIIPVKIVTYTDEQMAVTAWSENETRKQLNPVEKALAVKKFMERFGWTHAEVAEKIHVERSTVTNLLRLLKLPEDVLVSVNEGILSQRQASALIPFYELTPTERNQLLTGPVPDGFYKNFDDFITEALDGSIDSDSIRNRISAEIAVIHPEPAQFQFDGSTGSASSPTGSTSGSLSGAPLPTFQQPQGQQMQTAWLQTDIEGRDLPPIVDSTPSTPSTSSGIEVEVNEPVFIADGQPLLPIDAVEKVTTLENIAGTDFQIKVESPLPGNTSGTQAVNPPAMQAEVIEPKTWDESTYTLVLNFLAVDGNEEGRNVMVSLRLNQNMPSFHQMRESLIPLPWRLDNLIKSLQASFQGVEQVSEEVSNELPNIN